MSKLPYFFAIALLTASTSQALSRGMQGGGPIGPGSRYGLQPSASDGRNDSYARKQPRPAKVRRIRPKPADRR